MTDGTGAPAGPTPPEQQAEALRKAKAEADAAEVAARKAEREEEEAATPAAVARRAATAEKDAAAARRDQLAALIPDFSKVSRGELELAKGGEPTAGTAVVGAALDDAANTIKAAVIDQVGADDWRILVSNDAELAASDSAYADAVSGLERLAKLAADTLAATPTTSGAEAGLLGAGAVIGAVAQAVPGVLSLLTAHRTMTTGTATVDDFAASAAIAGVLKGNNMRRGVFLDSARLLPDGGVRERLESLHDQRHALVQRKIELEARQPTAEGVQPAGDLVEAIALIASVISGIDAFVEHLTAVPEEGNRSPLTVAAMREGLHNGTFSHALLVRAQSASGAQLVNDKPLWKDDTFAVMAAATITWVLIGVPEGGVLDAGVTTGTAQASGKLGDRFSFDPA